MFVGDKQVPAAAEITLPRGARTVTLRVSAREVLDHPFAFSTSPAMLPLGTWKVPGLEHFSGTMVYEKTRGRAGVAFGGARAPGLRRGGGVRRSLGEWQIRREAAVGSVRLRCDRTTPPWEEPIKGPGGQYGGQRPRGGTLASAILPISIWMAGTDRPAWCRLSSGRSFARWSDGVQVAGRRRYVGLPHLSAACHPTFPIHQTTWQPNAFSDNPYCLSPGGIPRGIGIRKPGHTNCFLIFL